MKTSDTLMKVVLWGLHELEAIFHLPEIIEPLGNPVLLPDIVPLYTTPPTIAPLAAPKHKTKDVTEQSQ